MTAEEAGAEIGKAVLTLALLYIGYRLGKRAFERKYDDKNKNNEE